MIQKEDNYPYLKPPEGFICEKSDVPGPFVTRAIFKDAEGNPIKWNCRYYRKHQSRPDKRTGSTWWAPRALGWWISIFFIFGSTFFALGALPPYRSLVGDYYNGLTFFIGSLFFTSAAFLQYLETINTPSNLISSVHQKLKIFSWEPKRIDWWATLVQLIGTLFFNLSTWGALIHFHFIRTLDKLVWGPDAFGSICFIIASLLAWMEVNHSIWSFKPHKISWRIAAYNLIGSTAFIIAAAASYVSPNSGHFYSLVITNLGTFIGGIFFLIGAVLLFYERTMVESDDHL
ncbi:MAG: YrhK family protein [Methanobacterium sp.]|nr:YrhK family protein [Methanobacterium sp.]